MPRFDNDSFATALVPLVRTVFVSKVDETQINQATETGDKSALWSSLVVRQRATANHSDRQRVE